MKTMFPSELGFQNLNLEMNANIQSRTFLLANCSYLQVEQLGLHLIGLQEN